MWTTFSTKIYKTGTQNGAFCMNEATFCLAPLELENPASVYYS